MLQKLSLDLLLALRAGTLMRNGLRNIAHGRSAMVNVRAFGLTGNRTELPERIRDFLL